MTTVPSHGRREQRRLWPWIVAACGLAVVAFIALFAWDGWKLMASVEALETHAGAAQQAVSDRDATALSAQVGEMQVAAHEFASHTTGPHWTVASWMPWVKDQTTPLQQAGEAVSAVADDALGPLSELDDLGALEVPPIEEGRVDPYVLEPYREALSAAAEVLNGERASLEAISLSNTIAVVREPFLALQADLTTLGDLVQGAHVAAELLPPMLGVDGERTYIVMVQTNAEPRTSGGIAGAVIELTVDDGRFAFARYVTGESMQVRNEVVAPLSDDELRVFTERMAHYPQDVNFTPEFPRSAELLSAFWERDSGDAPDGVIATDPVALGYMLQDMEPVSIDSVEVDGDNLADVMLNEVYFQYPDPKQADAFFALASRELFGKLLAGSGQSLTRGIEQAAGERRLLLWSADAAEQELLASTGIAGDFVDREDALGVFINDGSGSKIGYYIDTELAVVDRLCASDQSLAGQTVTLTMRHTYQGDVGDLPEYIGIGGDYVPNGEFHANVLVMPPVGMGVTDFMRDGDDAQLAPEVLHGRELSEARVVLLPGDSVELSYTLSARDRGIPLDAVVETPGPKLNVYTRTVDTEKDAC